MAEYRSTVAQQNLFGMWCLPDAPELRFPGRLMWDAPAAPVIEVLDAPPSFNGVGFEEPIPVLWGDVDQVGWITLFDCRRESLRFGGPQTHSFRVGAAITRFRVSSREGKFARRVEIELPALSALLGDLPLMPTSTSHRRSKLVRLEADDRRRTWSQDGVEVTFEYVRSTWVGNLRAEVTMRPVARLTSSSSQSYAWWYDRWLSPLANLVQIASAVPVRARYVHIWQTKHITARQRAAEHGSVWGLGITPEEPDRSVEADPRFFSRVLTADAIAGLDLHDVMVRTTVSQERFEVFYDMLATTITSTDRPLRNRYVDIIGALEAFHSQLRGKASIDPADFAAKRFAAIDALDGTPHRSFVKKWIPSEASYPLEQRLEHIRKLTGCEWSVSASAMAGLRNEIAHGNPHPDHQQLETSFRQALTTARRLALLEMGVG